MSRNGIRSMVLLFLAALLLLTPATPAQTKYQKAPKEISDILNAPQPPTLSVSPDHDTVLLSESLRYPSIADLAEPMLRLAGLRISPGNNGPHMSPRVVTLTLKSIATGKERKIVLPANPRFGRADWSPDGKMFAITNATATAIEPWVCDVTAGTIRRIPGVRLSAVSGDSMQWMPDGKTLLCQVVPPGRGVPPPAPKVPEGPTVQESYGRPAPAWTYQDLLKNPYDETLFDYYATSQLVLVDVASGKQTPVGKPGVWGNIDPSPDGKNILTVRYVRPYSYVVPLSDFPKEIEVLDRAGKVVYKVASLPLEDTVPTGGVPAGPRSCMWRPTDAASLLWAEALDGGNPKTKVPQRDKIMSFKTPFQGAPTELLRTEHRYVGMTFGEKGGLALVTEMDRDRVWRRTWMVNLDAPGQAPRLVFDLSARDRYRNPGSPEMKTLSTGKSVMLQSGDSIFLTGLGSTPRGDRPFLNRFNLKTLAAETIFRCDDSSYETVTDLLDDSGTSFLTRAETPNDPPNYYVRTAGSKDRKALTTYQDPAPQLRRIRKEIVRYKRPDGVDLSFTLYLPPGYKDGERLPTVIWAYPLEYTDAGTAGQVSGSANRFTTISGYSHLFFVLQGYAVLDDATMPIVGDPETVNNTYVEQTVASAKAAIDKAVEMGVTDRNRVAVGGHSYGAFMTANLLAHCDLFKAGIARSGAYNRTLTPFGFQSERRTLWEAPEMYLKVSPFMYAHKLKTPILLIHGEADNNSGTFPIQSERMYQAIKGNGGSVRYVTLPFEAHGYSSRESTEHVLYEMLGWLDRWVKNPK